MTDSALAPTGPAAGVVSAGEHARIASAAADAQAPSTRRAYAGQWARFAAWCRARGAEALPAAPVLVAAYLTERAETAKISTVRVAAAAIGAAHRARGADDPTGAASVRAVVAGIARQHAAGPENAPRQAAPSPRAGVLPVSGVARHARPGRMYGKLLDRNRKLVEARFDDMLKAQRQAVDRIVHRHRQLGAVLLVPTSATTSCGAGCCQPCPRRSCARTSPTWRTGRGATARPASSRRPSGTPG